MLYDKGNIVNQIFWLNEGSLVAETDLTLTDSVKFPIAEDKWQVNRTTRRLQYQVHTYGEKKVVGLQEVVQ